MPPVLPQATPSDHGQAAPFNAVVFDLDGTLWDSTATIARAWNAVVRASLPGRTPISQASIQGVMGLAHTELSAALFPDVPKIQREQLVEECYATEEAWLKREGARVYPGVREGLAKLAAHTPLAIVSNCQRGYIETFYVVTGLGGLFRDAECHGNTGETKAENLAALIRRQGFQRPVYVGDTAGDERAAALAGVPFLHAAYGFGRPAGPCPSFQDFPALTAYLLGERTPGNSI